MSSPTALAANAETATRLPKKKRSRRVMFPPRSGSLRTSVRALPEAHTLAKKAPLIGLAASCPFQSLWNYFGHGLDRSFSASQDSFYYAAVGVANRACVSR